MVRPIAFALVSANLINAGGNWILIYGKLGAPAMGAVGSGWSTAWSRIYLCRRPRRVSPLVRPPPPHSPAPHSRRTRICAASGGFIALGFPTAMQITLEIGVFALVTALIGRLGAVALASHQIALNTVSFTYMVPLGISSAAAVRVGQAIGRKDPQGAADAGGTAIFLGAAFMTCMSIVLLVFPRWIARAYTPDEAIIHSTIYSAGRRRCLSTFRRHSDSRHRCAARPRRHPHARCSATSPPTGLLVCRSAPGSAFAAAGEPSDYGPGLSLALILIGIVLLAGLAAESPSLDAFPLAKLISPTQPASSTGTSWNIRKNCPRKRSLHFIAAEVVVGEAFEVIAQVVRSCFVP